MRLSLFAVAALFVSSLIARADAVYTYTGQHFTLVEGSYTTSDSVTGLFTITNPLGDDLNNVSFTPLSFNFSDGVQRSLQQPRFHSFLILLRMLVVQSLATRLS